MGILIGALRHVARVPAGLAARVAGIVVAVLCAVMLATVARAQGLTVLPVSMELAPGEMTVAISVINQGDSETSFQVRSFAWEQPGGNDSIVPTTDLVASPPLGTIPANATQVVRVLLRRPPQGREATYRILLDQIPPPAMPGTIRIAVRLSMPVFAEPATRVAPRIRWHVEGSGDQAYLVGVNEGAKHATVRDIALAARAGGGKWTAEQNVSPYILPGATRRWQIPGLRIPAAGTDFTLTAATDSGRIDQPVAASTAP